MVTMRKCHPQYDDYDQVMDKLYYFFGSSIINDVLSNDCDLETF